MKEKIISYLGFAVRMKKAIFNLESIKRSRKIPYAVLYDESLGGNALKQITAYTDRYSIPLIKLDSNIGEILKREKVKLVGVLDESLAEAIIRESRPEVQ